MENSFKMPSDVKQLYDNLNELLADICEFLSDDKLDKLSPRERKIADHLIKRSKTQLVEISKVSSKLDEDDKGSYVDMSGKTDQNGQQNQELNIYSLVEEDSDLKKDDNSLDTKSFATISPFKDLSAKDLCRDIKYGYIQKQVRLLFFDTYKRMFAGIHNKWFLVYPNEKASKPCLALDLLCHKAKELSDENENAQFIIFSTNGENKKYFFIAKTNKDMQQWIVNINRADIETEEIEEDAKNPRYTINLGTNQHRNKKTDETNNELNEYQDVEQSVNQGELPEYVQIESTDEVILRNKETTKILKGKTVIEPANNNIERKNLPLKHQINVAKTKTKLPPPPPPPRKYNVNNEDDDEDNVYEQIPAPTGKTTLHKPEINSFKTTQSNIVETTNNNNSNRSSEDSCEYQQIQNSQTMANSTDSFSPTDDEEHIYDQLVGKK